MPGLWLDDGVRVTWWLSWAIAAPMLVLHEGAPTGADTMRWTTTWVGVPPSACPLAIPLHAGTQALPPTRPEDLIRDAEGRVVAIARQGRDRVVLEGPMPEEGPLVPPLWQGPHAQRVVARGFEAAGETSGRPADEQIELLDRVGAPVPPGAFVAHVVVDDQLVAHGGIAGEVRRGGSIVRSLAWIGIAVVVSIVGLRWSLGGRRRVARWERP